MIKCNLKWKINFQKENTIAKPKSIRREVKSKIQQLKTTFLQLYQICLPFQFGQPSEFQKIKQKQFIRIEEQKVVQPIKYFNSERKQYSLNRNENFKDKLSSNNRQFQTESRKFITQNLDNQMMQQHQYILNALTLIEKSY